MNVIDGEQNRTDQAKLSRAFTYALAAHGTQTRKESNTPYASHIIQVCGLVLEHGGTVEQAIGALLHDVVEDCKGYTIEDIERHFGAAVRQIVDDCTDREPGGNNEWRARKERYLEGLEEHAENGDLSTLVSFCDKRHNLGALVGDVGAYGTDYLERFNSDPKQQVWYYTEILRVAGDSDPVSKRLREEFEALLDEFKRLVGAPPAS
jgi:(p)ppGpp synthase/HD superfamily hydrolase